MRARSTAKPQDGWALALKNTRTYVRMASTLTLLSGLLLVLGPLIRHSNTHLQTIVLSPHFHNIENAASLLIGLVLIYIAYGLSRHKFVAWAITLAASLANIATETTLDHPSFQSLLSIIIIVILLLGREQFVAKARPENFRRGFLILGFAVLLALTYGTVGFWLLDKHDFGTTFSFSGSFVRTIRQYLLIDNNLVAYSRYGRWFLNSLNLVGIATLTYCLFALFRPLRYEYKTHPAERAQARALLEKYGGDIDDYFKLWPADKTYFFSADRQAFIAYGVARGVAICYGCPEGKRSTIPGLLLDFNDFCLRNGWLIAFMQASDTHKTVFTAAGFSDLLIGADAVIDLTKFASETVRNKYFRNIQNRFTKREFSLTDYPPPHSPQLMHELKVVSDDWLSLPGRREWHFVTGRFSEDYFEGCHLFVLRDEQQRAVAFVNELPSFKPGEATIDLMRHRSDAPSNTMDYLFTELLLRLQADGWHSFNLGMSPLAGVDFADNLSAKLLQQVYQASQPLVSMKGLQQYKAKFDPAWQPRYVYYLGGPANLPQISLALAKLTLRKRLP